jgi:CRP-like cAMP-binding protein
MDTSAAKEQLRHFFTSGKELAFPKRALILGYYEQPEYAYWIASGSVKVITCNREGVERIQHIYDEGELFPIKWLFDHSQFEVAFFALTDVRVRVKTIPDFRAFIDTHPSALGAVVHQQLAIIDRLVNLHIESAEERVIFGLSSLAGRVSLHEYDEGQESVRLPLSIQDFASTIHLSRETTGKVLRNLAKQGLVNLDHQSIRVYPQKLQHVLNP